MKAMMCDHDGNVLDVTHPVDGLKKLPGACSCICMQYSSCTYCQCCALHRLCNNYNIETSRDNIEENKQG